MSKHNTEKTGLVESLKTFVRFLNTNGVAIPFARDPKTQRSSVSLTLMLVSFAVVIVGLIGKASGFFGGVDLSQAMMLFGLSSGLYFSRKITKEKEAQAMIDKAAEEKEEQ